MIVYIFLLKNIRRVDSFSRKRQAALREVLFVEREIRKKEGKMQDIVQEWLKNITDEEDLAALKALTEEEKIEHFGSELQFGTGGLRGIVGMGTNCMNIYTVGRASKGVAAYMGAHGMKKVAISYDSRRKSRLFAETAACIFADRGMGVIIVKELMPTPFLSFLVRETGCDMGVMITASHNPAPYNGYKVYNRDGCQITDAVAAEVALFIGKESYFGETYLSFDKYVGKGTISFAAAETEEKYLRGIRNIVGKTDLSGLKIAYSALNGTGYRLVPKLLKSAGAEVVLTHSQCVPDENFMTCPYPNPEKREALELGLKTAQENGCDLLIATDPDADRVGIAVRYGDTYTAFTGNEVGLLLLQYLLEEQKKKGTDTSRLLIIKTIVTTNLAEKIAADYGAGIINVLTGFKYIGEQIGFLEEKGQANRFLLGFEESYGYLLGTQVRDKDALVASLTICKMAAEYREQGKNLKDVLESIYEKYGRLTNTLLSYTFAGGAGHKKIETIMTQFRIRPPKEICGKTIERCVDYMKSENTGLPKSNVLQFVFGENESIIVRPSGTEPNLKIYMELRRGTESVKDYFEKFMNRARLETFCSC